MATIVIYLCIPGIDTYSVVIMLTLLFLVLLISSLVSFNHNWIILHNGGVLILVRLLLDYSSWSDCGMKVGWDDVRTASVTVDDFASTGISEWIALAAHGYYISASHLILDPKIR